MKILNILLGPVNRLMRFLAVSAFAMMVVCVFFQVLFRYVFRISAPWTEELARFTFIWAIFLGSGIAFAEGGHLSVQLLVGRLASARLKACLRLAANAFCIWLLGMYVFEGTDLSLRLIEMRQTSPAMPSLLMGFVYLAIPLGSLLMILNILPAALGCLRGFISGTGAEDAKGGR